MTDVRSFPKPARRIVNPDARPLYDDELLPEIVTGHVTRHHIVPRGERGDDLPENLIWVDGHGTLGLHGVLESRCADGFTGLTFPEAARALVEFVEARPELLAYVERKKYPGWLRKHYSFDPYVCADCSRPARFQTCDFCMGECVPVGVSVLGREDKERAEGRA